MSVIMVVDDARFIRVRVSKLLGEYGYQVIEAKSIGADVILLIAANLSKKRANDLIETAHTLGLEVLTEIHTENELENVSEKTDIIGINNRNLNNFIVDINTSIPSNVDLLNSL